MKRCAHYAAQVAPSGYEGADITGEATKKMHYVELLVQRLAARDLDSQVAEFQFRVAILNGLTANGIPITEAKE